MPEHQTQAVPMITLDLPTQHRCQMLDITSKVQACIDRVKIREGLVIVHVPHTTAGVTINENADPDVQRDLTEKLSGMIPKDEDLYRHSEGNSDSHLKSSLVGCSQTVLIENGRLALGTWQGVYFCEFDGPRTRQFWVKLVRFG